MLQKELANYGLEGKQPELGADKFDASAPCQTLVITMGTPGIGFDVDDVYNRILDAYSLHVFLVTVEDIEPTAEPDPVDLMAIYEEFYIAPVDAKVDLRTYEVIPGSYGYGFDLEAAQKLVDQADYGEEVRIPMETIEPELTIDRALETYLKKGYTREWINQRLQAIQVRKELTDEWDARGVQKGVEYAILTDEISRAWSGMSTRQYKNLKGLKKENLRDNMTTLELVLNMLAEATTTEISKQKAPTTFSENMAIAREGGEVAGIARKAAEERTGVPVITSKNATQLNQVVTNLLEGVAAETQDGSGEDKK